MEKTQRLQRYKDRVCLVTASSTGIGKAVAARFAEEGATVIINSRKKENVDPVVKELTDRGLKAVAYPANVSNDKERQAMVAFIKEKFGKLDVLIPNAAINLHFGRTLDTTASQFDKTISVNLKSVFLLVQECHELLIKGTKPAVLLIASYLAYQGENFLGIYAMTKTALLGLNKVLARELQEDGIRVNCLAPGLIKTTFSKDLWEGREREAVDNLRLRRLGTVDDIANATSFLCCEDADYIVGETIMVGGMITQRL